MKLVSILLLISFGNSIAWARTGRKITGPLVPKFTQIISLVETQPIKDARLVYFDHSAAAALGWMTPPGRVGLPQFDGAILKKVAYEIKKEGNNFGHWDLGESYVSDVSSIFKSTDSPPYFVELDDAYGAGRAGYLEIDSNVWVNNKGIGITGEGNTGALAPGPPSSKYDGHRDGSATLEEAIKEAVLGRVADEELEVGASRVVAIVYTGRTLNYPDGRRVPLALVVRTPMRRVDLDDGSLLLRNLRMAAKSLGKANAKRTFKGDFVNLSNLGADGEWIDFGTTTFTEGYAPLGSSQHQDFLREGGPQSTHWKLDRNLFNRALSEGLLEQMGIPHQHLEQIQLNSIVVKAKLKSMSDSFVKSVYWNKARSQLLDFEPVAKEALLGNVHFHEFFRSAAKNYFASPSGAHEAILDSELKRLLSLTQARDENLIKSLKTFIANSHDLFDLVAQSNGITDRATYGKKLEVVATFKNRDITELTRPSLFVKAGALADQFVGDHNPQAIQSFIDNTVSGNHFGTGPVAESLMMTTADTKSTRIYVQAFKESDGSMKLFNYPDLPGAKSGEQMSFRVSTDGWASYDELSAKVVDTKIGKYFIIEIPHGTMPVTAKQVELVPFVKGANGEKYWLAEHLNLRGPPLLYNERIGLPPSQVRAPGYMKRVFGIETTPNSQLLEPRGSTVPSGTNCLRRSLKGLL